MYIGLFIILACILVLPFTLRIVESNLEYFLFIMGVLALIVSGSLSFEMAGEILGNYLLYMITGAVLVAGLLFRLLANRIKSLVNAATVWLPFKLFIFIIIVILGLLSSIITAIVASLVLVELVQAIPLKREEKIRLTIIACFSIGLGAALTPVGEPLSTIVISSMHEKFFYLLKEVGIYIIPGITAFGIFGAFYIGRKGKNSAEESEDLSDESDTIPENEDLKTVFIRAGKVFIFVIALELLSRGFKPLIDKYVVQLSSNILYWINMSSAVLDNATLAAAEISPAMDAKQIQAVLMGLLISGGMLIPGNIPNIISAGKLKIKSREWAALGFPLGLAALVIFYIIIFVV